MSPAVPFRWRIAGLLRSLPEFRGRDRLHVMLVGRRRPPAGMREGSFGPGLRFRADYSRDGSFLELFYLQYENPSLTPVLEAFLEPGDTFFDVGANVGVYSGWAARLVGARGSIHAFEPVPGTREALREFIELNELGNVSVVASAVGRAPGALVLHLTDRASGLATAAGREGEGGGQSVEVPMTSLDEYIRRTGCDMPQLVKIDIEGYEFEAILGAERLLSAPQAPAVVFEAQAGHLARADVSFESIRTWFDRRGFRVFSLTPGGLSPVERSTPEQEISTNCLAARPEEHAAALSVLNRTRFRRNQTC